MQQGLRNSAPCLVGGPERGHRRGHRRFHPSRMGGPARRVTDSRRARVVPAAARAGVPARPHAAAELPSRNPFPLSTEISTIYKRDGATRKVHHLLYAPTFEAAGTITAALAKVGNLASDGRPILGLDSRHLLEI